MKKKYREAEKKAVPNNMSALDMLKEELRVATAKLYEDIHTRDALNKAIEENGLQIERLGDAIRIMESAPVAAHTTTDTE